MIHALVYSLLCVWCIAWGKLQNFMKNEEILKNIAMNWNEKEVIKKKQRKSA